MHENIIPFKLFPRIYYTSQEVKMFLEASMGALVAALLVVFVTTFYFYEKMPHNILFIWGGFYFFYTLFRYYLIKKLEKSLDKHGSTLNKDLKYNIIFVGVGGILWGLFIWLAVIYTSENSVFYLFTITLGLSAGSMATGSFVFLAFLAFSGSIIFLQISALLYFGGMIPNVLAFFSVIFFISIYRSGRLTFNTLRRNHLLTQKLEKKEIELTKLNNSLEQKVIEKTDKILYDYLHDRLTGLPNQLSCHHDIEIGVDNYIVLFDVSDFSTVNKQYGKLEADKVLVQISQQLLRNINSKMTLYKGESDRFIIFAKNESEVNIIEFCKMTLAFFDLQEIQLSKNDIYVTFNIGIATIDNVDEVMLNSEYALSASKKTGAKNHFFYRDYEDRIMNEKEVIEWVDITKKLIEDDAIIPYYQAIKDIPSGKIYKYEVLARGVLDEEIIAPFHFLEPARRMGLITTITRVMISKSFTFFEHNDFDFSINITEEDLIEEYLIEFVKIKMERHNIKAERITFEILENINIYSKNNAVSESLKRLKELGCKIAIDDFGVENSNFLRLLELDVDFLKLDGIFIKVLDQSLKSQKIVQTIVNFSKSMGIKVIAEFVENQAIYELLEEFGVDFAQGYYIAKPMPELFIEHAHI